LRTSEASSGGYGNWDAEFITSWVTEGGVTGKSVGPEGNLYVANSGIQQFTPETGSGVTHHSPRCSDRLKPHTACPRGGEFDRDGSELNSFLNRRGGCTP